jgi:hypothetical protein
VSVEGVKQEVRERVWRTLEKHKAARFPGTRGRIPNFVGAEAAADRLAAMDEWKSAPPLPTRAPARFSATLPHTTRSMGGMASMPTGLPWDDAPLIEAALRGDVTSRWGSSSMNGSRRARRGTAM